MHITSKFWSVCHIKTVEVILFTGFSLPSRAQTAADIHLSAVFFYKIWTDQPVIAEVRAARSVMNFQDGRGGEIRTHDPFTPSEVRYQAALRPDKSWMHRT